jgi:hypothetical protein
MAPFIERGIVHEFGQSISFDESQASQHGESPLVQVCRTVTRAQALLIAVRNVDCILAVLWRNLQ